MKLGSTRELSGLKPVLKDPESLGQDPVYWVFSEVGDGKWANTTVTAPGRFNGELPKTFGHYHPADAHDEIYKLVSGDGLFLMQKKHFGEDDKWVENMVDEVVIISAQIGDEITIKPEWGHSWSNRGTTPLITFDNWTFGHTSEDYRVIEELQGMAYYLVEEDGEVKAVPNSHYQQLPEPTWITAAEFKSRV